MAQQTAVEWLAEQLPIRIVNSFQEEIAKAKQMEKEQIMQSYNNGKSAVIHIEENKSLEQYYNETYKQDENTSI